jgi:hypothetical protein
MFQNQNANQGPIPLFQSTNKGAINQPSKWRRMHKENSNQGPTPTFQKTIQGPTPHVQKISQGPTFQNTNQGPIH